MFLSIPSMSGYSCLSIDTGCECVVEHVPIPLFGLLKIRQARHPLPHPVRSSKPAVSSIRPDPSASVSAGGRAHAGVPVLSLCGSARRP